jgi:fructokinase
MIVVAGEALVDLVPSGPQQLTAHGGGGPFNTSRALARLGQRVAFLGSIADDGFGEQLLGALRDDGVLTDTVLASRLPTTLALAELDAAGSARYRFYTDHTAAPALTAQQALAALPAQLDALHVGSLGLVLVPIADAMTAIAQRSNAAGALVMVDPNVRPAVIADRDALHERLRRVLATAHVVKASGDDLAWLYPEVRLLDGARALLAQGPSVALITLGGDGALVVGSEGATEITAPVVQIVDTIGAGDAFSAGFLAWWLHRGNDREQLQRLPEVADAAAFACMVASKACERPGADPPRIDPRAFPSADALPARRPAARTR